MDVDRSTMHHAALERSSLEAALRQAIVREELQLLYQPLVDLQSGDIDSLEALVRWQHPTQGLVAARQFISVAEEAGLGEAIGDWVLRRACHDLRAWREAAADVAGNRAGTGMDIGTGTGTGMATRVLRVAINVSPRQFGDPRFAAEVTSMLTEYGVEPAALTLEITEAALTQDNAACAACLHQLKALGVSLTLDDFGAGHSSLGNLKRFPFDAIKIDGEFIRDIVTSPGDAALAKAIISMAHNLGIVVVAENVETEGQCDFLRRHMCDLIQGYFFAPPMAPAGIAALLRERRALPPHLLRQQKKQRSLLLVDDEPNIVAALKRLLRRDDYLIHTAASGQQGLDLLALHPVDVILSDQRMPGMSGADFLRKARVLYPDTIRIMLSGYTELQAVTDAVNEGAIYKFLTKPWDDAQLRNHLAEAFRLQEIAGENARLNLEVRTANQELARANRRMEQLMAQMRRQMSRDEISLNIARELLQNLPLAVIGMDDTGMIAFINPAAEQLFRGGGALLGNEACRVLPELFPPDQPTPTLGKPATPTAYSHHTRLDGQRYAVVVYPMGEYSASRGSLITLSRIEECL